MTTTNSVYDIIIELANTSKRNEKLAILEANRDNHLLKESIRLAYDPNIKFWIKKIPSKRTYVRTNDCLSMDIVLFSELGRIYNRNLTGHAAIDLLIHLLSTTSEDNSKVIELIIKKDLDCGIAESTINKVWPKLIPEFKEIMKCHDSIEHIEYPAFAQTKCDGSRCIVECLDIDGDYIAYSSGGNPIDLGRTFRNYVRAFMKPGEKFDGELVMFDAANMPIDRKTSNGYVNKAIKGSISIVAREMLRFIVWDIIDTSSTLSYKERFDELYDRIRPDLPPYGGRFELVDSIIVNSQEEAFEFFELQISKGLEGAIIKNFEGVWKPKRVKYQGKIKAELECDVMITGWEPHIKHPEKLGSFFLTAYSEDKTQEMVFNVGSGISKDMRETNPEEFVGKVATIRFNQRVTNKKEPEKFTSYADKVQEGINSKSY